jgi:hypothetical protein
VIYEHRSASVAPRDAQFEILRTARYGAVALSFLKAAA